MQDLKVTCIQSDLYWEDKEQNIKNFEKKINSINADTNIIVLPEMFSTGFSMNSKELAEQMDGPTINWMKNLSHSKNAVICGSLIINEENNYYNRLIWAQPNGDILHYDKMHLFGMGDEHKHYSPGTRSLIVNYLDWKIRLVICYDIRFPALMRNTKNDPYDLMIVVANWPDKRISHWDALLKARAIENQSYIVAANRIGLDGNQIPHSGHSAVYDPYGEQLFFSEKEETHTEALSAHHLQLIRRQYPFLNDGDTFYFD